MIWTIICAVLVISGIWIGERTMRKIRIPAKIHLKRMRHPSPFRGGEYAWRGEFCRIYRFGETPAEAYRAIEKEILRQKSRLKMLKRTRAIDV